VLAVLLAFPFKQGGLGMANTLSATCNLALLFFALRRKLKTLDLGDWQRQVKHLLLLAVWAGMIAWSAHHLWEMLLGHATLLRKLGEVFVPMILATAVYFGTSAWLHLGPAREMWGRYWTAYGSEGVVLRIGKAICSSEREFALISCQNGPIYVNRRRIVFDSKKSCTAMIPPSSVGATCL
jgi:hypothetical protein